MRKKLCFILCLIMLITGFSGCKKEAPAPAVNYAVASENFGVTAGMVKYYFNLQYAAFVKGYSDDLEKILDVNKPLSEQNCTISSEGITWYDYFMNLTKERMSQLLALQEQAKLDGKKLNDADKKKVQENISLLKNAAKAEGKSYPDYLKSHYGEDVTEEDIKKFLEIEQLGTVYYDSFLKKLDRGDDVLETYYSQNKKTYSTVSFLMCQTIKLEGDLNGMYTPRRQANEISESGSEKEFKAKVFDYVSNYYIDNHSKSYTEKKIREIATAAAEECKFTDVPYDGSTPGIRWAFDPERKTGDTEVFEDEKNGMCYVYYLLAPMHRAEYKAPTVRQLFFEIGLDDNAADIEKKAEDAKLALEIAGFHDSEWKSQAKSSDDSFARENGGLYEDIIKGTLSSEKLEEWIFSPEREPADCEIIKTDEGYHLVYFESAGREAWKVQTDAGLCNREFQKYLSDICDEFVVEFNSNLIYSIEEIKPQ